jgi:hypothetical protein
MRLVTKSKMARMAGVTRQAIGKACRGPLAGAVVGSKLDLDHESVRQYLAARDVPPPVLRADDSAPDVAELLDWTLRAIVDRFGTLDGFKGYLQACKMSEEAQKLRLHNRREMRRLVSREYVATHVIGLVEEMSLRLLRDSPRSISRRLYALAGSGADIEEAEAVVREQISSQLKIAKARVRANLHKAGTPTQSNGAG